MKMNSSNVIIFNIVLLSFFGYVLNDPCKYLVEVGKPAIETNSTTLEGLNDDEKKQKCFSFSNSDVFDHQCCYNKVSQECIKETTDVDVVCPKKSQVYNNCGMAGIYQPITSVTCTEISLVQGYCCYANFTDGSSACIRTKELNKNKNSKTNQMEKYFEEVKEKYKSDGNELSSTLDFDTVICEGFNLKNYWHFIILTVISLF